MATIMHWRRHLNQYFLANPIVSQVLSPSIIEKVCRQAQYRWRNTFWSPATTLITFILQVLSTEKTLRFSVASLLTQLAARGATELPSADPTAYCQARIRLPSQVIDRMVNQLTDRLRQLVDENGAWLGHRVWIVDGTSISMPDTPELQSQYPQPHGQKSGCGFPMAQMVAMFCWTTGAVVNLLTDTISTHELTLYRKLWHHFAPSDVVLADRAYGSYVDIVRLQQKGVHGLFRLHHCRKADFRRGIRLGSSDQLLTWERPKQWLASFGISQEDFEQLPEKLMVRLVRISHTPRGFRSRTIVVVTTLLDPVETPADEIRALYRDRWTAELNLRDLKIALGMDVLRGQSLDVVHKEIAMHMMAYNLIRLLMWYAAREHDRDLHRLSFTGTLHRLRTVLPLLIATKRKDRRNRLISYLLTWIAMDIVPLRPNRIEPRRRKRRPKQYSLLNKPRKWYHHHKDVGAR